MAFMKRVITLVLATTLISTSFAREEISDLARHTDMLYRQGAGAQDGAFTALSVSMLGWGVGLAVGIAVLAAALNHGSGTSGSSHAHCD